MMMQVASDMFIPEQRRPVADTCHRCGGADVALKPDLEAPGRQRCAENGHGCFAAWRPHCPIWCTIRHDPEADKPFREGVWFHHSDGIEVTTGESTRSIGTLKVDLCAFERVGGGLQTPTVMIGDDCMLPEHARALASALIASAQMADMSGAALRHGEAHEQLQDRSCGDA